MILVILAAGQGSRLKAKTKNTPKCLIKIDKKSIVDYIYPFIKKFNKTIIVSGYKSKLIEQKFKNNKKIFFAFNKKYKSTNMVYSLFQAKKFVKTNEDIIVCYSDVIFDCKIYEFFKKNRKTFIPIKKNWLILWKKRMSMIKIINDVVFNQVLVAPSDDDDTTQKLLEKIQASGECWAGSSIWKGKKVIRISVCSWATSEQDISRSVKAFVDARNAISER